MREPAMDAGVRSRSARPKWTRFARAAARSLSRDIYTCAVRAGVEVNFIPGTSTSAGGPASSVSSGPSPFCTSVGDGSKEDVYSCLRGHLGNLGLSESETGLVLMITYGLMKSEDLQTLPTTWRLQLMAALRFSILHGIRDHDKAVATAAKLQTYMEMWRPGWRQDYDVFTSRHSVRKLMEAALRQANLLQKTDLYKDEKWQETSPPPMEFHDDSEEVVSI